MALINSAVHTDAKKAAAAAEAKRRKALTKEQRAAEDEQKKVTAFADAASCPVLHCTISAVLCCAWGGCDVDAAQLQAVHVHG